MAPRIKPPNPDVRLSSPTCRLHGRPIPGATRPGGRYPSEIGPVHSTRDLPQHRRGTPQSDQRPAVSTRQAPGPRSEQVAVEREKPALDAGPARTLFAPDRPDCPGPFELGVHPRRRGLGPFGLGVHPRGGGLGPLFGGIDPRRGGLTPFSDAAESNSRRSNTSRTGDPVPDRTVRDRVNQGSRVVRNCRRQLELGLASRIRLSSTVRIRGRPSEPMVLDRRSEGRGGGARAVRPYDLGRRSAAERSRTVRTAPVFHDDSVARHLGEPQSTRVGHPRRRIESSEATPTRCEK